MVVGVTIRDSESEGLVQKAINHMRFGVLCLLASVGCGATPAKPSELGDLAGSNCPAGTTVDASAEAKQQCGGKAGLEVKSQSGVLEGLCVSENKYEVKCVVNPNACKDGAKEITREKVICADVAAASETAPAKN